MPSYEDYNKLRELIASAYDNLTTLVGSRSMASKRDGIMLFCNVAEVQVTAHYTFEDSRQYYDELHITLLDATNGYMPAAGSVTQLPIKQIYMYGQYTLLERNKCKYTYPAGTDIFLIDMSKFRGDIFAGMDDKQFIVDENSSASWFACDRVAMSQVVNLEPYMLKAAENAISLIDGQQVVGNNYVRDYANRQIAKLTSYGKREEIAPGDGYMIVWSNAAAKWKRVRMMIRSQSNVPLDANMFFLPATSKEIDAVIGSLNPLPLYQNSHEAYHLRK